MLTDTLLVPPIASGDPARHGVVLRVLWSRNAYLRFKINAAVKPASAM